MSRTYSNFEYAALKEYRQRFPLQIIRNKNWKVSQCKNILFLVEGDQMTSSRRTDTQLDIPQEKSNGPLNEQGLYPCHLQRV